MWRKQLSLLLSRIETSGLGPADTLITRNKARGRGVVFVVGKWSRGGERCLYEHGKCCFLLNHWVQKRPTSHVKYIFYPFELKHTHTHKHL